MPYVTFDDFAKAVSQWTAQQRAQAAALLDTLIAQRSAHDRAPVTPQLNAFVTSLRAYLKYKTGVPAPSPQSLLRGSNYARFAYAVEVITTFATNTKLPPPHDFRTIKMVSDMYCDLVGKMLKSQNRRLTWSALVRAADLFPPLFAQGFPDYISGGIMDFLWRHLATRGAAHPLYEHREEDAEP